MMNSLESRTKKTFYALVVMREGVDLRSSCFIAIHKLYVCTD